MGSLHIPSTCFIVSKSYRGIPQNKTRSQHADSHSSSLTILGMRFQRSEQTNSLKSSVFWDITPYSPVKVNILKRRLIFIGAQDVITRQNSLTPQIKVLVKLPEQKIYNRSTSSPLTIKEIMKTDGLKTKTDGNDPKHKNKHQNNINHVIYKHKQL
jgi:hypothetical protein